MSSLHPARRGAERFNSLLQGEQEVLRDSREAELLELVSALQTLPRVEARPEFVADLRERLLVAADADLVATGSDVDDRLTVGTRRTPRERRLAVALGGFAIVSATTGMAVAAQSALPGDVLYPVKRAMENAEAGFSVSDEAKGNTLLQNASGRLDEVDELSRDVDVDVENIEQTLNTFADQASEASELLMADYEASGSEESIDELRSFIATSIPALAELETVIPEGAHEALLQAAQVLFEIDRVVDTICPLCEGGILDFPPTLLSAGDVKADTLAEDVAGTLGQATKPGDNGTKPGNGDQGDQVSATDPPANPLQLPTQAPTTNGSGTGGSPGGGPKNPVGSPSATIPTTPPSVGVPVVDDIVSEVVEGVDDVLGGLTGGGKLTP